MGYTEHEIKIIYRKQHSDIYRGKRYMPYEVMCEGRYSGYGETLEEAIRVFDKNNMAHDDDFMEDKI